MVLGLENKTIRRCVMLYLPREEGQGLVEYALILVLIAIIVIAVLTLLGPEVANIFSTILGAI